MLCVLDSCCILFCNCPVGGALLHLALRVIASSASSSLKASFLLSVLANKSWLCVLSSDIRCGRGSDRRQREGGRFFERHFGAVRGFAVTVFMVVAVEFIRILCASLRGVSLMFLLAQSLFFLCGLVREI